MPANQGFSILEMLISLFLASLILVLLLTNLNHLALYTFTSTQKLTAQDNTITSLILLRKQFETAHISECANSNIRLAPDLTEPHPELTQLAAYRILSVTDPLVQEWLFNKSNHKGEPLADPILMQHLSDTFYVKTIPPSKQIKTMSGFSGEIGDVVVIDDCEQALISSISSVSVTKGQPKTIEIANFNPTQFKAPFSISLLHSKMYYLGQTQNTASPAALFRSDGKKRDEILPYIQSLVFTTQNLEITINAKPQFSEEVYHAHI